MANGTIGGISFTDGATISYTGTGRFISDCRPAARRMEIEEIVSNGLDGAGTKDYGLREREITLEITYIESSESGVVNLFLSDTSGLTNTGVFAVTIAGQDLGSCRLVSERCQLAQPRSTGLGTVRGTAVLVLRQIR